MGNGGNQTGQIIIVVMVGAVICAMSAFCLLKQEDRYSLQERRVLASFPETGGNYPLERLVTGEFEKDFEEYALDQFPLRDALRTVKAYASRYILGKKDDHGIYLCEGHLSKLEYPLDVGKIDKNLARMEWVWKKYIEGSDCRVYISIIPDKNYFLAGRGGYPVQDYGEFLGMVRSASAYGDYIDIYDTLELSDFYRTDQHWRQECIGDTVRTILNAMKMDAGGGYEEQVLEHPFYGAYYGQASLFLPPDEIHFLTNEAMEKFRVTGHSTGKPVSLDVYDMERALGRDPYEMFLGGADPLVIIDNPLGDPERELVMFRDSFGSSIAPMLAEGYGRVTMVDLRYLDPKLLGQYLDFDKQDVLFLYSTLVLGSSLFR